VFRNILVPLDGSEMSEAALPYAAAIAGPLNLASMGALHASEMYARNVFNFLALMLGKDGALNLDWNDGARAQVIWAIGASMIAEISGLSGEGSGGLNGGPAGDLYVLVRIREHAVFARHGADLLTDLPVSFTQLALGAELDVPVLGGTDRLKIPAGTQPHQVLRLRGKGMPRLRERGHGDACYRVLLEVPQKLTARQREALEAFEAASKDQRGPLASAFVERMKKLAS